MNYLSDRFLVVYMIALLVIPILIDILRKYNEYKKKKDSKVKYLPCIPKLIGNYGLYIFLLILFIPSVLLEIKSIKDDIKIWGSYTAFNMLYNKVIGTIIIFVFYFVLFIISQIVSGNVILINDEFVVIYNGRINLGEVNCVDVFPVKGIFKRRKIDIYANGKLHSRFSIRDKYTSEIINIFKDRCIMV